MSNKTLVILIIVIAILAVGGYFYWSKFMKGTTPEETAIDKAGDAANAITESATQGVLPSMAPATNPLEDVPDVNPINTSNPYKDIKTNPFQ